MASQRFANSSIKVIKGFQIPLLASQLSQKMILTIFLLILMLNLVVGVPDTYTNSMVRGVQEKTLRKFYNELFGKKNYSSRGDSFQATAKDKKEAEKFSTNQQRSSKKKATQEKPASRSVDETTGQTKVQASENHRDPTFVLSKLMFHMAQLF